MQDPWSCVVRVEPDSDVIASFTDIDDITNGRVDVIRRRVSCALHHVETMLKTIDNPSDIFSLPEQAICAYSVKVERMLR